MREHVDPDRGPEPGRDPPRDVVGEAGRRDDDEQGRERVLELRGREEVGRARD